MRIRELLWDEDRLEHIARHHIERWEVEEVCWGYSLFTRGREGKLLVLGQTAEGRYLFVALAHKGGRRFKVITARQMNRAEKRRYRKWKGEHGESP